MGDATIMIIERVVSGLRCSPSSCILHLRLASFLAVHMCQSPLQIASHPCNPLFCNSLSTFKLSWHVRCKKETRELSINRQPHKSMKTLTKHLGAVVVLGLMTLASSALFAQETGTTTTITSTGTVSAWKPNAVAVKVSTSPEPIQYSFTKTTTYVDENGNPVSVETIRTGTPVTVYYQQENNALVADKVVVNRSVTTTTAAPPAPVNVPPTSTTTTTASEVPASPAVSGVVTDADSGHVDLRTAESSRPIHYKAHDSTAYVDENGNPVPRKLLTPGTPVTLFYEQYDGDLYATRVVLKNPALLER